MKLFLIILLTGLLNHPPSDKTKNLEWNDLIPSGLAFDDPFAILTEGQLYKLGQVARVEFLLDKKPKSVNTEMKLANDSLKADLLRQGINADTLISKREYVKEMRMKNANAVVEELHMAKVKLAGYMLPLNLDNKKSTEFLLVPWVGACIHTPPPPNNQIVHVVYPPGFKVTTRFQAVVVEGTMHTEKTASKLFLVDGSNVIQSSYCLKETHIEPYKAK